MQPLFEAKATFDERITVYNIFRIGPEKYKAQIVIDEGAKNEATAPAEMILTKDQGTWHIEDNNYDELGATLGAEIDVFNNGYGELLGRIGVS